MRRISKGLLVTAMYVTTITATSSTPDIFARACSATGFSSCSQAGLPSDFCCGSGTNCVALAGNTTVLCCPGGSNCNSIASIPCDITLQNNTAHPDSTLKTTALTGILPTCGDQCCPFGYTCGSPQQGVCIMNSDQSNSPATSSTSSSTPTSKPTGAATTTSSNPTITPTVSIIPSQNTTASLPVASCDKFPVGAILAGFFPGMVLGILLSIAAVCFLGARRRNQARRHSNGSSFGNNISEPQPNNPDMRTDFLRKQPMTPSTLQSSPRQPNTVSRVKSIFRKSGPNHGGLGQRTMASGGAGGRPPVPFSVETQQNVPVTPPLQRDPSYENINIFADGDTASALRAASRGRDTMNTGGSLAVDERDTRASHQTTFSDMMQRSGLAGLTKGQPYVYRGNSSVYGTPSPPRTRTS